MTAPVAPAEKQQANNTPLATSAFAFMIANVTPLPTRSQPLGQVAIGGRTRKKTVAKPAACLYNVYGMRIISKSHLVRFWQRHPDARTWLKDWHEVVQAVEWKNLADVRRTYPHADSVIAAKGKPVTVFNVRGNKYRMATAIHYNTKLVFILWIGTHAEYDKGRWKARL